MREFLLIFTFLCTFTANAYISPIFVNANQLQGQDVSNSVPVDGNVLVYNGTTDKWEPGAGGGGGGVTSVTASVPILSSGGSTPNITCRNASGSQSGCLTSADWTSFNLKQPQGNYITDLIDDVVGNGPGVAGTTVVAIQGTAVSSTAPNDQQFLKYNGTSTQWEPTTVSIGSVSSVALADGSSSPIYSISGSPVTSSGTLTFTLSNQSANRVFAGPTSGGAAQPTFRSLVSGDIPSLSYANQSLSNLTGPTSVNQDLIFSNANHIIQTPDESGSDTKNLSVNPGSATNANGGALTFRGGSSTGSSSFAGGLAALIGGGTSGGALAGNAIVQGGGGSAGSNGGDVQIIPGSGTTPGVIKLLSNDSAKYVGLVVDTSTTSYSLTFPLGQGAANSFIKNDGSGNLSFASAVTSVGASSPLSSTGGQTPSISCQAASGSQAGCLSSTDWSTFNSKQSALTFGSISTSTTGVSVGSGSNSTVGPNVTVNVQTASGSQPGLLSTADWTTFNGKQSALTFGNLTDAGTDGITVTSGTGAVIGSGTSIAQHVSDSTHNGYLSSADWSTFNGKQAAGNYITATTGDVSSSGPGSAIATLANTKNMVYVDFLSGDDSTGTGNLVNPWKTLQKACNSISPSVSEPYVIQVSGGNNDSDSTTISCPPDINIVSDYEIQISQPFVITGGSGNDTASFTNITFVSTFTWVRNDSSEISLALFNSGAFGLIDFEQQGAGVPATFFFGYGAQFAAAGGLTIQAGEAILQGAGLVSGTFNFKDSGSAFLLMSGGIDFFNTTMQLYGGVTAELAGDIADTGYTIEGTTTGSGTPTILSDSGSIPAASAITGNFSFIPTSLAIHEGYTPANAGDWSPVPDNVASALDTLAASTFVLPSLTAGSVIFSNGSTLAQDNANFFWDNTIKSLEINGDISVSSSVTDSGASGGIMSAQSNTTLAGTSSNTTIGINGVAVGLVQAGAENDKTISGMNFSVTRGDMTDQGILDNMSGANSLLFINSDTAGVTNNAYGFSANTFSENGTLTNLYDFYSLRVPAGPGVVTNHYGVYLENDSTTPIQNWMSGKTQFGASSFSAPSSTIEVHGPLGFVDSGNQISFVAPTLSGSTAYVLPGADGSSGDVLSTDGAGNMSWTSAPAPSDVAHWVHFTVTYSDLATAAPTNQVTLYTLPLKGVLHGAMIHDTTSFNDSGGPAVMTQYSLALGTVANPVILVDNADIFQAPSDTLSYSSNVVDAPNFGGTTDVVMTVTSDQNLDTATQGQADVWLYVSTLP